MAFGIGGKGKKEKVAKPEDPAKAAKAAAAAKAKEAKLANKAAAQEAKQKKKDEKAKTKKPKKVRPPGEVNLWPPLLIPIGFFFPIGLLFLWSGVGEEGTNKYMVFAIGAVLTIGSVVLGFICRYTDMPKPKYTPTPAGPSVLTEVALPTEEAPPVIEAQTVEATVAT